MSNKHNDRSAAPLNVAVTREIFVPHPIQEVFDFVTAENVLPKILTGYGMVPGVAFTSDVSGPWDRPGLTHYDRPSYFAYRVSDPSFALKHLMTQARGEFWFQPADGGTKVKWTYTFQAKNGLAKLPLLLFVKSQWKGYMDRCLANVIKYFTA